MVSITYFFDQVSLDVDNIPKPIFDALKLMVYTDDSQITDLSCRKRNLRNDLRFQNPSPALIDALIRYPEFLHIVVAPAQDREV